MSLENFDPDTQMKVICGRCNKEFIVDEGMEEEFEEDNLCPECIEILDADKPFGID